MGAIPLQIRSKLSSKSASSGDRAKSDASPGDRDPGASGGSSAAAAAALHSGDRVFPSATEKCKLPTRIVVCMSEKGAGIGAELEAIGHGDIRCVGMSGHAEARELVQCPGVLLVFAIENVGKKANKILNKWSTVVQETLDWAGSVCIRMPRDSEDWQLGAITYWMVKHQLQTVKGRDECADQFATDNVHVRFALHGDQ